MKRVATVSILLMLPTASALAHLMLPPASPKHPCVNDLKRFCDNVTPGQGRIFACMDAHKPQLTAECRAKTQMEEDLYAQAEARKAELQAKRIREGKKPDPFLNPTPIGVMPGQPGAVVVHKRPAPPNKQAVTPQNSQSGTQKSQVPNPQNGQSAPQNSNSSSAH